MPHPYSLSLKKNKEKEKSYFYEGYEMQGFGVRDKIKTSKSMLLQIYYVNLQLVMNICTKFNIIGVLKIY